MNYLFLIIDNGLSNVKGFDNFFVKMLDNIPSWYGMYTILYLNNDSKNRLC